jgi:hypothetical protein
MTNPDGASGIVGFGEIAPLPGADTVYATEPELSSARTRKFADVEEF